MSACADPERVIQGKHSTILSTFFKLPFVIKIFVLSIFELPFYKGFNVLEQKFKIVTRTSLV